MKLAAVLLIASSLMPAAVAAPTSPGGKIEDIRLQCPTRKQLNFSNVCYVYARYYSGVFIDHVDALYTVKMWGKTGQYRTTLDFRLEPFFDLARFKKEHSLNRYAIFVGLTGHLYLDFHNPLEAASNATEASRVLGNLAMERASKTFNDYMSNPYYKQKDDYSQPEEVSVTYTLDYGPFTKPVSFTVVWK